MEIKADLNGTFFGPQMVQLRNLITRSYEPNESMVGMKVGVSYGCMFGEDEGIVESVGKGFSGEPEATIRMSDGTTSTTTNIQPEDGRAIGFRFAKVQS